MAMISFKDIPILIMKLIRFSMKTMFKCLHKYPFLSGTLLLFFLLHLFFPFAFVVLVCSVPFFVAAFIVYRRFRFLQPGLPDDPRDLPSVKCDTKNTPKRNKPYISAQMSRRRNFRAKIDDPVPHKDKPMIEVSSPMKHFLSPDDSVDQDEDDQNLIWRNEKIIDESLNELKKRERETKSSNKTNPSNSQIDDMSVDPDDEDEEVKEQDMSGNPIVAWNEDDQKNLMDLGLSEIERNQRLENLIAKRRARKFLMAIRGPASLLSEKELETVLKMSPVSITKMDNLPSSSSSDDPIPGSAPSVLLPARNPFDIPYDPTEEKPNLRVDGFQQEFWGPAAYQISRHESFTRGPSFGIYDEHDHHLHMHGIVTRESRFARLRRQAVKGDHDTLIEKLLYQQQDDTDDEESCSSPNKHEQQEQSTQQEHTQNISDEELPHNKSRSQESSSSDVENQRQKQEITSSNQLLESVSSNPMKNNIGCPSSNTMYGSRDSYIDYLNHKVAHNLTHSIASDMQVEVSEPGSPSCNIITPVDLHSSASDGEQMENETINSERQEESPPPPPPPPFNDTMQVVEEEFMKQQDQDVIEIAPTNSSSLREDKTVGNYNMELVDNGEYSYLTDNKMTLLASSSSSTNIIMSPDEDVEDCGGLLASQSHSNEECTNNDLRRDRRQISCESLDQVVEIPEEDAILFVDNSDSTASPLSPGQGGSRPTLLDNPEEIDNHQPPIDDDTDTRNIQDEDEFRNQTGHDIISDTRKLDDEEYINPFANSVEKLDYDALIQQLKSEPSVEDLKEESSVEQLNLECLDKLESRDGESQPSLQESKAEGRAPPIEQFMSEVTEGSQTGVFHADEQLTTKPVEGT